MARMIDLEALLKGCDEDAFEDGIRIDTELVPWGGQAAQLSQRSTKVGPTNRVAVGPHPMIPSPRQLS